MRYYVRSCAGSKVCEFLPDEFKVPHTEVDPNGLDWAPLLAEQERAGANSQPKVDKIYEIYESDRCDRPVLGGTRKCNGKSVIRSRAKESNTSLYHRLFIGCEHWQPKERGHLTVSLDGLDPAAVLRRWGRDRCHVHSDILQELNISWNEGTGEGTFCLFEIY
jgi:hypothetical protein